MNTSCLYIWQRVAHNLPEFDMFYGLSGSALKTGKMAKNRGCVYICDRGSLHIRYQDTILQEEYALQGKSFEGIDPRVIAQEAEYELTDAIAVPSSFVKRSFIQMGIPEEKLYQIPYKVDFKQFHSVEQPQKNYFDILFVGNASFRKGIPYLLQAVSQLQHPNKRLTIVGTIQPDLASTINKTASEQNIIIAGHVPQI